MDSDTEIVRDGNYLDQLRSAFCEAHDRTRSWRKVAEIAGVDHPIPYRMAISDYVPVDRRILAKLGLIKPTQYRDLYAMPVQVLRWKLEQREEF